MAKKNVAKQDSKNDKNKTKAAKNSTKTAKKSDKSQKNDDSQSFDLVQFLAESKEELSKVVWPSRQQLISESAAVILMVILVATTIYFVDNLFVWISGKVF